MTAFLLILMLLVALADLLSYRNLFSPVVMLNSLFMLILILACQRRYNIALFDDRAVLFIELGVIFFDAGVVFIRLILRVLKKERKESTNLVFRWRFITLLTVIVTISNMLVFYFSMKFLINGGNYIQLRNSLLGYGETTLNTNVMNPVLNLISNYISGPGLYALLPIGILMFFKHKNNLFTIIVFLDLVLNILSSGSRIILLYTTLQILAVISYNKIHISKKIKRISIILIVIAVTTMIILSNLRSSNSLFRSFYAYFSGPVVLFSYWINYVDHFNIQSYGLSFFYPFTWLINAGGNLIGVTFEQVRNVVSWQSLPQDVWVQVFPMQSMNAFSTMFYFFYEDLRLVGICVESFFFGSISGTIFYQAFLRKKTKYLLLYLLGIKALIGSFMIWQLGSTSFFLSLILLLVCIKRENFDKNKFQNII